MKKERKKALSKYQYDSYNKNLVKHWEECEPEFAHIEAKKWRGGREQVFIEHREKAELLKKYAELDGASVLDYGIGDGFFGYVLFDEYSLSKYIGVDIAKRTLNTAASNLASSDKGWVFVLDQTPADFKQYKPDIITSFACIQHFPNKEYLDEFCDNITKANPSVVMLQIRNAKNGEYFNSNLPALACITTPKAISKRLPNHKIVYRSKIIDNGYQTVILSK